MSWRISVTSKRRILSAIVPIAGILSRRSPTTSAKGGEDMSEPQISSVVAVVNPHDMDTVKPSVGPSSLSVRSFGLTDAGKVRKANEDQFLIAVLFKALQVQQTSLPQARVQHSSDQSYLFVVADGMGGH